jgi:hypothetical protein
MNFTCINSSLASTLVGGREPTGSAQGPILVPTNAREDVDMIHGLLRAASPLEDASNGEGQGIGGGEVAGLRCGGR